LAEPGYLGAKVCKRAHKKGHLAAAPFAINMSAIVLFIFLHNDH